MQIHLYASQGDIPGVARELSQGVLIDSIDESDRYTPLMAAVTSASAGVDMVRFLIEAGADLNAVGGHDQEPVLGLAIRSGGLNKVRLLLDEGADIHYQKDIGSGAMMDAMHADAAATEQERVALVELLLSRGARTDGLSYYGQYPSMLLGISQCGRFEVLRVLRQVGVDLSHLQWTELMSAIALGSVTDIERALSQGADLAATDFWDRTPWLLSLQTNDVEKAQLLLAAGSNRQDRGRCGKTPLMYAIESECRSMLLWLLQEGFDVEAADDFRDTPLMAAVENDAAEFVRILLQAGASVEATNSIGEPAIDKATDIEILRLLLDAGAALSEINGTMRAALTGVSVPDDGEWPEIEASAEEYAAAKHRRFGTSNPEVMNLPFWKAMVRSGATAWQAQATFDDTEHSGSDEEEDEPVWCFHRFGKSITELPDGRFIEVGGEHEDYYMPEFCIYNDVVVHHGGGRFDILGYPEDVFPPTDFHSATLVGNSLYIIGSVGYMGERKYGQTPVYRLDCETLAIEKIETSGEQAGWISGHKAVRQDDSIVVSGGNVCALVDGREEHLENTQAFGLDLASMMWRRAEG